MFSFRLNITIILNKQPKGGGIVIGGENKKKHHNTQMATFNESSLVPIGRVLIT